MQNFLLLKGVFGGSRKHRASNLGHAQSRGPLMKSHETSGGLSMFGPSLSNSFMAAVQPKPRESLVPDYTEGKHISGLLFEIIRYRKCVLYKSNFLHFT